MNKPFRMTMAVMIAAVLFAGCSGAGFDSAAGRSEKESSSAGQAEAVQGSSSASQAEVAQGSSSAGQTEEAQESSSADQEEAQGSSSVSQAEAVPQSADGITGAGHPGAEALEANPEARVNAEQGAEVQVLSGKTDVAAGVPQIILKRKYEYYNYGDVTVNAHVSYDTVELTSDSGTQYPALAAALGKLSAKRVEEVYDIYSSLQENLRDSVDQDYELYDSLYDENSLYVRRADSDVLSLMWYDESYGGGAHGYYAFGGYSYDAQTGKQIQLSDLVTDDAALRTALQNELEAAYPDIFWLFDLSESLGNYDIIPPAGSVTEEVDYENVRYGYDWVLEPEGVTFFFNPYALASYADGAQEVLLRFDKYPQLFNGVYAASEGRFAKSFRERETIRTDTDGDGQTDSIVLYGESDGYNTVTGLHIVMPGGEFFDQNWLGIYSFQPTLVRTGAGKYFLYVEVSEDNDYKELFVYDVSGKSAAAVGTVHGGISPGTAYDGRYTEDGIFFSQMTDPDSFYIENRMNLLSSMDCVRRYAVGDNGMPSALQADCDVISDRVFTLKRQTAFPKVKQAADGTFSAGGEERQLSAGERLRPVRTDNESWVDCELSDGTQVRVNVETGENGWPQMVNGFELEELLDGVMFAG